MQLLPSTAATTANSLQLLRSDSFQLLRSDSFQLLRSDSFQLLRSLSFQLLRSVSASTSLWYLSLALSVQISNSLAATQPAAGHAPPPAGASACTPSAPQTAARPRPACGTHAPSHTG
jgi:hypothetical protein